MTQEELADSAGVSVRTVRDLESGRVRYPRAATVRLLADALGLRGDDLGWFAGLAGRNYWADRATEPTPPGDAEPPDDTDDVDEPPRQLPPPVASFTGRRPEIDSIAELLACRSAAAAVAIGGMGGVGKTSLAVQVGHLVADRFPDGQLYVNLHRHTSLEALHQILSGLGVAAHDVSADLDQAAARCRSALAGRRVLLVLDDAVDTEQVEPLLPGAAGCAAIITSRCVMSTLPQVRHVALGVLPEHEAIELFAATVGQARVDREPDAAAAVVQWCGLLPLAVHLAGARLASRPRWPIAHLAERLASPRRRLDELERDDIGVRAFFAASVDRLAATRRRDARAFGLLGLLDCPAVSTARAAQLLGLPEADAERTLERLADLHLIEAESPERYRMHELLRIYARERAPDLVPDVPDGIRHITAARPPERERPVRLVSRPGA